jgi:hypothetical protein
MHNLRGEGSSAAVSAAARTGIGVVTLNSRMVSKEYPAAACNSMISGATRGGSRRAHDRPTRGLPDPRSSSSQTAIESRELVTGGSIDGRRFGAYSSLMSSEQRVGTGLREARVRPESAAQYPWAPAGIWTPAGDLATDARRHGASGDAPDRPDLRALPEAAFEFRGGAPELTLRDRARTRWTDHPARASGRRML